ncbi:MAG: hypothetical protein GF383_11655 [Candidatus Lokiarchaeota archaeon]|nr:hypothetical protein [Candidatus Lokiarchaeota archaeon]MBD3341407.1 hypothetical protein [Candidatus Lokiarchaeota archaeon]
MKQNSQDSSAGIEKTKKQKIKEILTYAWCFLPLLLSHHPDCNNFRGHTLKCGKFKLCIGCFVGYPVAIITYLIMRTFNLAKYFPHDSLFIISIIFLSTFVLSPLNLTKIKIIKVAQKAFIGVGAAFLLVWIRNLPNPRMTNLLIMFIVFSLIIFVLNLYHVYGFLKTCYKCETPFDWGNCPGFDEIRVRMKNYGLFNFLSHLNGFSDKVIFKRNLKEETKNRG